MRTGIGARLKGIAKVLACLCAIEMFLPGGTLIVLGYLLTGRRHLHASAEGERAVTAWSEFRRLLSANTAGGQPLTGPRTANRRCEVPSVAGES